MQETDLFIIGGGINGAGIAADASLRGLSVILVEQNDLASATSSYSSKLIHGGLRYLEYYDFKLVRKALLEREVLLTKAPHNIKPLEFVLPHDKSLRPKWMIRLGLFLYDYLSPRKHLKKSSSINLKQDAKGQALKNKFHYGFSYYDCMADDARLVVLNAMLAKENAANILTHTKFVNAKRGDNRWQIKILNNNEQEQTIYAKALVNAAGPWVNQVIDTTSSKAIKRVKLVKGSHIIVKKLYPGEHAYILQNHDGRVIFVIPYEEDFSLIGTTDVPYEGDPAHVAISDEEINYLCKAVNYYFEKPISKQDLVWSYAGVRPLQEDEADNPSAVTRDYALELNSKDNLPALNVLGGKITTFRKLAKHALNKFQTYFPNMQIVDTRSGALPGGDIENADVKTFKRQQAKRYPWLAEKTLNRYCNLYGTLVATLLENKQSINDLGQCFGADLYAAEVDYLIQHEFATCAEDVLWRRTKLGLHFTADEAGGLQRYIGSV